MVGIFTDTWLILEWIIFILMIGPLPLFFFSKYRKDKAAENKGGAAFNLGYVLFFVFTSLNQLVYLIDANSAYQEAVGWVEILVIDVEFPLLLGLNLDSQIVLMVFLFFCGFLPIMFPVEKYIQKWEKYPITKLVIIGAIGTGLLWLLFCYLQLPQPIDSIPYQIVNAVLLLLGLVGFLISFLAFIRFYLKLAIASTGAIRKKSLIITFGILFMYVSLIGGNLSRNNFIGTPLELLGPVLLILGIIILIYGFQIKGL